MADSFVSSKVAVAVAGSAPVSYENLEALLKNWLMIETDEERNFRFFLPADSELSTPVVDHTSAWLDTIDAGYTAIVGKVSSFRRRDPGENVAKEIKDFAQDVADVPEGQYLIDYLLRQLTASAEADDYMPYLMLAWGEAEEGPDDATRELLDKALAAGITVLDLTRGLDDLSYTEEDEDPEDEPEVAEQESAPEEPVQEMLPEEEELTSDTDGKVAWPDEAVQEAQAMVREPVERPMPDLATTLAFVCQRLDYEDRANAANNMMAYYNRPLTLAVRHHLDIELQKTLDEAGEAAVKAAEAVSEPVSEPTEESAKKTRGKPRDTASDVVKVLINEKAKTMRLAPTGRGRYKKDEVAREMTRAEYQALLDSEEYAPF